MRRAALLFTAALAFGVAREAHADVQPIAEDYVRNLDLPTIQNARDLGGLRGSHGFIPHGRFYRAATLVHASEDDRKVLIGRGIDMDIDLRTGLEAFERPDRLAHDARFAYTRMSLLGVGISDWFRAGNLRALYLHVLGDHQPALRDLFHTMAHHDHGAILYHCTSGKDRTGVVTALLLDLAGVERDTIVRDYAISAHYLGRGASNSPPAAITAFLDELHTKYGGARNFLARIGLGDADIRSLLVKLGQA